MEYHVKQAKRFICGLLFTILWVNALTLVTGETRETHTPSLRSESEQELRRVRESILENRRQTISRLLKIVQDSQMQKQNIPAVVNAIEILGELRAREATRTLVQMLDYRRHRGAGDPVAGGSGLWLAQQGASMDPDKVGEFFPAVKALIKIRPATKKLIDFIKDENSVRRRKRLTVILKGMMGKRLTEHILNAAISAESDAAKTSNLKHALQQLYPSAQDIYRLAKDFAYLKKLESNKQVAAVEKIALARPEVLIRWIRQGKLRTLSSGSSNTLTRFAIRALVKNRIHEAIPMLKQLHKSEDVEHYTASMAGYGVDILTKKVVKEEYPKGTPRELVLSYAEYLRKLDDPKVVKDEEKEFWVYPKYYRKYWKRWKEKMTKRFPDDRRQYVQAALRSADIIADNPGAKHFVRRGKRTVVTNVKIPGEAEEKFRLHLYKDMQGKWRLSH